jgi:hypothetical protein
MKKKKMRKRRRLFLIVVGCLALALDRLEGKPAEPQPVKRGRIKIVN